MNVNFTVADMKRTIRVNWLAELMVLLVQVCFANVTSLILMIHINSSLKGTVQKIHRIVHCPFKPFIGCPCNNKGF